MIVNEECEHRWSPRGNGISICELCARTGFSTEKPKNIFEWQRLDSVTERAKVYGGWLIRTWDNDGISSCFIPDEHHRWEIDNE